MSAAIAGRWLVAVSLTLAGCGGSFGAGPSDRGRDETVQVEITSSPSGRPVKASVTGAGGGTTTVSGTTPFSTEVRIHLECGEGETFCLFGRASFEPLVNDPSDGALTLCLSALGQRRCSTATVVVTVTIPG